MSKDCALLDRVLFDDFADLFDHDEMRTVITAWHADVEAALKLMQTALERGDLAQVARTAHRTAGGGLALGATSFAAVCEALRARADSSDGLTAGDLAEVRRAGEATHRALTDAAGM